MVVRLAGSNQVDSTTDDAFNKLTTLEDQLDRNFDEYELETERAGPVFQLTRVRRVEWDGGALD